ncbi:ankyrin repeat domain-containing protein [Wohlfahrtiimonas chitiniclastica]|uniref:ankyrin repeat domain-containing protein n=1 Tax=Wohlfahrtiimonas chitiniclastica TaxID=400946 RepID=UPI001BCC9D3F|nr:ankyrin repeat domain-containing protein [Wohlfahrtiimonas chitiniclastica]
MKNPDKVFFHLKFKKLNMAKIRKIEELIVELQKAFGIDRLSSIDKKTLLDVDLDNKEFNLMIQEMIDSILDELDLSSANAPYFLENILEIINRCNEINMHIYTMNAEQKYIDWLYTGFVYIPLFAHLFASMQSDNKLDKGMPGHLFWYLPLWNPKTQKTSWPINNVMKWLSDILGDTTDAEKYSPLCNGEEDKLDTIIRTLKNWEQTSTIPKSSKQIKEVFRDNVTLNFRGSFNLPIDIELKEQIIYTVQFIKQKSLADVEICEEFCLKIEDWESLRRINEQHELPEPLQSVAEYFIHRIKERYQKPSISLIRQRLLIARASQHICKKINSYFSEPEQIKNSVDQLSPQSLQLINLFQFTYNQIIENIKGDTPSQPERIAINEIFNQTILSIIFKRAAFTPDNHISYLCNLDNTKKVTIKDIFFSNEQSFAQSLEQYKNLFDEQRIEYEYHSQFKQLLNHKQAILPFINKLPNTNVLLDLLKMDNLSNKNYSYLLEKISNSKLSPQQNIAFIIVQIRAHFENFKTRNSKVILALLQQIDFKNPSPETKFHMGLAFYWKARYLMNMNQFEDALQNLKRAYQYATEYHFGDYLGLISRELFALEICTHGLSKNCNKYYYNMLQYNFIENKDLKTIEDAAQYFREFLPNTIYKPYIGIEKVSITHNVLAIEPFKKLTAIFMNPSLSLEDSSEELDQFILKYKEILNQRPSRNFRKDSLILTFQKMFNHIFNMGTNIPIELKAEQHRIKQMLISKSIPLLHKMILQLPNLAREVDLKNQSPLIFAAAYNNLETVRILLPLYNIKNEDYLNIQDYIGRTALHAAVRHADGKILELLLNGNPP